MPFHIYTDDIVLQGQLIPFIDSFINNNLGFREAFRVSISFPLIFKIAQYLQMLIVQQKTVFILLFNECFYWRIMYLSK